MTEDMESACAAAWKFVRGQHDMLIDGKWRAAQSCDLIAVEDPSTEEIVTQIPAGDAADIDAAVGAARRAFDDGPWPQMRPGERAKLIWKLADLIEQNAEELAVIEAIDVGQPLHLARLANVGAGVEIMRYLAGWAGRIYGDTVPATASGDWHIYTLREPCGVVGQIIPWNVPFSMAVFKLGAALAAGCSTVLKPAELTSLSTLRLGELVCEAGFPDGVVNIVTGTGAAAGAALVAHSGVEKIAFTGSTDTGKAILRASSGSMKRVTLELGGKAPVLILPDADLDRAIAASASAVFFNSGQTCTAGSRIFAPRSIAQRVIDGLAEHASRLKVGPALEEGVDMGPLVSAGQMERVRGYIASGVADGASIVQGGKTIDRAGYFLEPTVFAGGKADMKMVREEIFGPVVTVLDLEEGSLDHLAAQANDSDFGLSAVIWTQDIHRAHKLARKIKAGSVRINSAGNIDPAVPFGGFKQSGLGRERGREGVEMYTEMKSVVVAL